MEKLLTNKTASITEIRDPGKVIADAKGQPHVIPICFAFDGEAIYSVLDAKPKTTPLRNLRRVRNIIANPQVSLVVDHYEEDWKQLQLNEPGQQS